MLRVLPVLLGLVLSIYCVVDCIRTDEDAVRGLPKLVWVFVVLLFPIAGSIAWLIAGRPRSILDGWGGVAGPKLPRGPRGPDDDPDFLKRL